MKIRIAVVTGSVEIDADVYGCWAAHPTHKGVGWTVTHVPTGCSTAQLSGELDESDARRIARLLAERAPRPELVPHERNSKHEANVAIAEEYRFIIEATFAEELAA